MRGCSSRLPQASLHSENVQDHDIKSVHARLFYIAREACCSKEADCIFTQVSHKWTDSEAPISHFERLCATFRIVDSMWLMILPARFSTSLTAPISYGLLTYRSVWHCQSGRQLTSRQVCSHQEQWWPPRHTLAGVWQSWGCLFRSLPAKASCSSSQFQPKQ